MYKIHLDEVKSTNTWLLDALNKGALFPDETVVWTMRQTAGRGQVGNSWEAEPDRNVSFSMLLMPDFLAPHDQFVISEITALSVAHEVDGLIKWPNDIFVNEGKICGILIEHKLQGGKLSHSVLGIGINVNQTHWIGSAPNPTSLKLQTGHDYNPEEVMDGVIRRISAYYRQLRANPEEVRHQIHEEFLGRLYRKEGWYPYVDAATGEAFEARIVGVEADGRLILQPQADSANATLPAVRTYWFKEVKFVLPCGVTKE
ncbi:MAG: biotin--[Bacteroidales bacterium]|nr:biotin--[acetyl-CoA-carboxylase] ligase [Bacteroidales bacterium]